MFTGVPGVSTGSETVQSLDTTTAKMDQSKAWHALLHGAATSVCADKRIASAEREEAFKAPGATVQQRRGRSMVQTDRVVPMLVAVAAAEGGVGRAGRMARQCDDDGRNHGAGFMQWAVCRTGLPMEKPAAM